MQAKKKSPTVMRMAKVVTTTKFQRGGSRTHYGKVATTLPSATLLETR